MSPFKLIPDQNKHPISKYVNALLRDQSFKFVKPLGFKQHS